MASHKEYMQRAVKLAYTACGHTKTNPMVGAVIVHNDRIIGEGFHTAFGQPHAEIEALNSVREADKSLLPKSSMYVTLEPCSHYGKTPPCSLRIIHEGIRHVYMGCADPFPEVNGRGKQMLRENGIQVTTGIAEVECKKLLHRFQTHIHNQRPYIHVKWAQSQDGYLSLLGEPTKITEPHTAFWTHKLRSGNDAIMVGTTTLLTDDPSLDNRLYPGPTPIKIILDRHERIRNRNHRFFKSSGATLGVLPDGSDLHDLYDDHIFLPYGLSDLDQLHFILQACYQKNIASIFLEGGRHLLDLFIENDLWDQADILRSRTSKLGQGVRAPTLMGKCVQKINLGNDECLRLYPESINVKDYLKPS